MTGIYGECGRHEKTAGLSAPAAPTRVDGVIQIRFCSRVMMTVDLRTLDPGRPGVTYVPEHLLPMPPVYTPQSSPT